MKRIAYMIFRNAFQAPYWLYKMIKMAGNSETYTEQDKYRFLSQIVTKINKKGNVKVISSGTEHLPSNNGFILFPNHQGLFDSLALFETCPKPFSIVIKKEAVNYPIVKQVIGLIKGIPIDRADMRSSIEVIRQVTEQVRQGRNFVIFAEGTRSPNGNNILPFKGGTFKSAINARCPIVPVALIDSYRPFDLPSIKKETVQVHYLEPIYPEQYKGLKSKEIADIVYDRIKKKIVENI